jgi:hypothetical protein
VIEAQCASILVPHDHRHINQKRIFSVRSAAYKYSSLSSRTAPETVVRRTASNTRSP